jgi:hypothetical protein
MRNLVVCGMVLVLTGSPTLGQESARSTPLTPSTSLTQTSQPAFPASDSPVSQSAGATRAGGTQESAPPLVENLRTFDPGTVDVTWAGSRWLLTAGDAVLKDFGRKESEARLALRLIRGLQLNQYGTVGWPVPQMEYWLTDGAAPHGPVTGCTVIAFDSASLHLEETLGQWCVRDSRHVLFNFGSQADDARQAYGLLRKYGFEQVAIVGQRSPSMFVFLANRYGDAPAADAAHTAHPPATHDTPETTARKAEELKRLKERIPGLDAETVAQPTLKPLRTPDQPHQPFSSNVREYGGDGPGAVPGTRPAGGIDQTDRIPFDWRRVDIRLEHNAWRLASGSFELANFGPDQDAARQALDVIRYYRFTEQHLIGRPQRHFSYFLVNGLAPRGLPFGVSGVSFEPLALQVHQVDGKWGLCMGQTPVIVLGEQKEEASDLLEVIRRQRFDLVCTIGRPEVGFTFLVRTR